MSILSEQIAEQSAKIKKLEGLSACPSSASAIQVDAVKANLAVARSNLLIAEALNRIASRMR